MTILSTHKSVRYWFYTLLQGDYAFSIKGLQHHNDRDRGVPLLKYHCYVLVACLHEIRCDAELAPVNGSAKIIINGVCGLLITCHVLNALHEVFS